MSMRHKTRKTRTDESLQIPIFRQEWLRNRRED